ncbi:hypothetical protein ACLB2K_055642 [Fragaria x ananassa]
MAGHAQRAGACSSVGETQAAGASKKQRQGADVSHVVWAGLSWLLLAWPRLNFFPTGGLALRSKKETSSRHVATIGRIHHVNVVQLIGFCVEGSTRALVYDFMPNGSLDKYIFLPQGVSTLSFKKIFEIARVARGIDYLHRGCDMQILHFDIKPHNILLDENFTPKVSDFGLARLYPLDNSIVSLTAVRGTIGYIAPELFYKNIGGVSYKADVYSFGMLLMEMAGRRKNLNAGIEYSSQFSENYFPSWVSNQLNEGKDIEIEDATEDEMKIIKKMIVVAMWCIQMKPSERPSMTKVVEMLEGELESLQIPPKPFLYPQEFPAVDSGDTSTTTGDHQSCGDKRFELSCEVNSTTAALYLESGKYYVKSIHYNNFTIRVVESGVQKKKDYCSTPLHSITKYNSAYPYTFPSYEIPYLEEHVPMILVTCATPMNSTLFIETVSCLNITTTYSSKYSYFMVGFVTSFDLGRSCKISQMLLASPSTNSNMVSCEGICDEIVNGFELSWFTYGCGKCKTGEMCELPFYNINNRFNLNTIECNLRPWIFGKRIYLIHRYRPGYLALFLLNGAVYLAMYQAAKLIFALPCITALLRHKWRRRHMSMYDQIEDFLQSNNNLMPVRYSYSDIKKMAGGFKEKLGEGGYGTVYKAKLRSGRLVAIKMLGKSKANGQEFINEVATIGRIHHVNVVQLIGFCVDGTRRALVYDFMPNGSLEKHIFLQQGVILLSFNKIFEIALGVARGIEYLHRGCNMQILHFDIKPHNILLDENFIPKVSDFGLARLYPLNNSIVSLTAVRGTIGYIAPELFYKNIGGVSYKADVYSFGMLLMEMAGRRKNLNATIEHSSQFSQIYFPTWVADQLNEGKDIQIGDATEDEKKTIKKMIVVALWCIQMKPSERPSMSKVVEMLEGELESLQIPPKPFLYPQQMPVEDIGDTSSTTDGSTMMEVSTEIN